MFRVKGADRKSFSFVIQAIGKVLIIYYFDFHSLVVFLDKSEESRSKQNGKIENLVPWNSKNSLSNAMNCAPVASKIALCSLLILGMITSFYHHIWPRVIKASPNVSNVKQTQN